MKTLEILNKLAHKPFDLYDKCGIVELINNLHRKKYLLKGPILKEEPKVLKYEQLSLF